MGGRVRKVQEKFGSLALDGSKWRDLTRVVWFVSIRCRGDTGSHCNAPNAFKQSLSSTVACKEHSLTTASYAATRAFQNLCTNRSSHGSVDASRSCAASSPIATETTARSSLAHAASRRPVTRPHATRSRLLRKGGRVRGATRSAGGASNDAAPSNANGQIGPFCQICTFLTGIAFEIIPF